MHPDLDLHGVLRAAYHRDLEAEAAKVRLIALAGRRDRRRARREERLLPLAKLLMLLVPHVQRWGLGFGEVPR